MSLKGELGNDWVIILYYYYSLTVLNLTSNGRAKVLYPEPQSLRGCFSGRKQKSTLSPFEHLRGGSVSEET